MYDDIAALFYNNVIAAFDDYVVQRDIDSSGRDKHLRSAIDLATALFHFREHLPAKMSKSRKVAETECPDYRLIADVVNATKHAQLAKPTPQGPPLVKAADDVQEVIIITLYEDSDGVYSDSQTVIMVKCTDGTNRNFDVALTNVLNYWSGILSQAGVAKYPSAVATPLPGKHLVNRRDARNQDLEILKGIRFRETMQILKYDPTKGYAEPVDLTGASLQLRIYKPPNIVDTTLTVPDHGDMTVPVELTDEQAISLHKLKSDSDKEAFLLKIIDSRQQEIFKKVSDALREKSQTDEEG